MGSISGDVNSGPLCVADAADLASRPVASLKSGDESYVVAKEGSPEGPLFFYRANSALAASDSVIVPTSVGAGAGRWLSFAVYGGVAASIEPFTYEFFIDAGTAIAPFSQDGSAAAPFSTIQAGIEALIALGDPNTVGVLVVTPGQYAETLDLSGLVGDSDLSILGEGAVLTGNVLWTPSAEQRALGLRFYGITVVGNVAIDGAAVEDFLAIGRGLVFEGALVVSPIAFSLTACGRVLFLNSQIQVLGGVAEFVNCGDVFFRGSRAASSTRILFSVDPDVTEYTSNVQMFESSFFSAPGSIIFQGEVVVVADSGTTFESRVLVGNPPLVMGSIGAASFTSCSRFLQGLAITLAGTGDDDVAARVDLSRCSLAGTLNATVAGGVGRATLIARNADLTEATINLQSKVDADFRNATFNQQNLTGNAAATCRRSVFYTNQDISSDSNSVAIPVPPMPDNSYTVELTPVAAIATSPWAVTAKAADGFDVILADPNPGLLADIVLTPFDNAPP